MRAALDRPAAGAAELADAAARRAGLTVARIDRPDLARAAADLLRDIWRYPHGWPVPPEVMLVLSHTDNYAVAAHCDGRLVAASVAWSTGGGVPHLHSHITGVLDGYRGRSVGQALKLDQRAWALQRGFDTITWTFDPLHRRNAAFNIVRLGARVSRYLPDFYGPMSDGVNRGTPSDRVLVEWDLCVDPTRARSTAGVPVGDFRPLVVVGPDRHPVTGDASGAGVVSIRVPDDVEALRGADPTLARAWQQAVSQAFANALAAHYQVIGFHPDHHYLLRRTEPHAS